MKSDKLKRFTLLWLIIIMMFSFIPSIYNANAIESTHHFDATNVLDDLESSPDFSLIKYPFDYTGLNKSPGIINVVEWCYSPFKPEDFALYIYFYNPQNIQIDTTSIGNRIQIATKYSDTIITADSVPTDYETFQLIFCNKSERQNYEGLFYKFRIIDHKSSDGKTIQTRVNSLERRYDISGVTFVEQGGTPKEYTVGGSYRFTGYAAGYGPNEFSENTLKNSGFNALETIKLQVTPTTFRSESSNVGAFHQNQLNSVYFSVPEKYFTNYGDLQKIKAEWYEYKTKPMIIVDNLDEYNELLANTGVNIGQYNSNITYSYFNKRDEITGSSGVTFHYDIGYNVKLRNSDTIMTPINTLYYAFMTDDLKNDTLVSSEDLENYIYNYKKTFDTGKINTGSGTISNDLFEPTVDNNRTRGYNVHEFDANEKFNLLSYSESHNWFNKFLDYGFWAPKTEDTYSNVSPIDANISSDILNMSDDVLSKTLLVSKSDATEFKTFYNQATEKNERTVLFRFAQTDYYSTPMTAMNMNGLFDSHNSVLAQESVFFDFKIIHLTFQTKDTYKVIPVTMDPLNIVSGIETPKGGVITGLDNFLNKIGAWGVLIITVILSAVILFIGLSMIKGITGGNWVTKIVLIILLVLLCVGAYYGISWAILQIGKLGGL